MKTTFKKTLSLLFALVMVLSVFSAMPVTGAAEEYTSWEQLQNAINNSGESEVTLTQNITAPDTVKNPLQIPNGKNIVLDLNGYTISRNRSSAYGTGQVIVVNKNATLTVKDSSGTNAGRITGGWATYNGSGIYVYGTLILEGGSVTGNKCGNKGAGIYLNGGNATIKGGVIDNNTSAQYGAGVYCDENTSLTMTGGIIRNNAAMDGGAFYLANGAKLHTDNNVNINCNKANGKGAVAYLEKGSYIYAVGITLFNNTAPGRTGYQYDSYGNSFYREDTSDSFSFRVMPIKVRDDTIYTSWSQLKKDIESGKNKNIILSQDLVATGSDTEIKIQNTYRVTVDLNGFCLNRNMSKSVDHGGVFRVEPWSKLTIIDSSGNNSGKICGGYSINGGGICNHGELVFKGGTITGNRASKDGGGILTREYGGPVKLEISGGIVSENKANYGGGVYVDGNCNAFISKVYFVGNSANTDGGGIYGHEKSTLNVENCVVRNNNAKYGAGIYLKKAVAIINKCRITDNSASGHVGGLFNNYYSECTVNDSEFSYNTSAEKAGAVINNNQSTLRLNNTVLRNNKASTDGGAIYANNDAGATYLDGCTIEENNSKWGAGIYVRGGASAFANNTEFTNNKASLNGGAVWMGNNGESVAEFTKCTFTANSAGQHGGGIYTQGKGTLSLVDCEMDYQIAETGKGGCIYAGDKDKTVIGLVNVDFYDNYSKAGGGAIYANNAAVGMKELCKIFRNSSDAKGGNIWLTKNGYISNPGLYEGSRIHVYPESKTVAREISEFQTRYILLESQRPMILKTEKIVDTPIVASIFSNSNTVRIILLAGFVVIACVIAISLKRKDKTAGGAENDDE